MDEQTTKKPYRSSVQLQFAAYFFLLTVVLLALLNTYPLRASRDVVFSEKESALMSRASVLSSSLSLMETLTEDNTRQVLSLLDTTGLERVLVTDPEGTPLYDTLDADAAAPAEVKTALKGKAAFRSKFDMTAFDSGAAVPVRNNGRTIGAVYILEHDADQAELIVSIQHRLGTISLAAALLALVIIFFSIRMMTRRITMLADGVRTVQSGDYSFRLKLTGNDELTELGSELNHLTERLETTEAERRRFVSDASHELKTPLASIRLLSDSIVQSESMDAETMREFVTDIGAEAERLQRTTEKLLNLSRRDDGVKGDHDRDRSRRVLRRPRHRGRYLSYCIQPRRKRDQVQPPDGEGARHDRARGRPLPPRRGGHRHRHPRGRPAERFHALLPRGQGPQPRARRQRPRPLHRARRRQALRRRDHRRGRRAPRHEIHGRLPGGGAE